MYNKHSHLSAFSINRVTGKKIPAQIVKNAKKLKELIDECGDDLLK